jgi:hypothetical protein
MKKVSPGQTYVGVVEDVQDPNKEGRVKARVLDIFDDVKKEDLPWASPWKDLSGGQFGVPDIGKVVIIVFEQGDPYKPEYICSEHWNINLESKLKSLSDTDYASMRSVLFDHKTQIYSNDSEGLKVDYKFNNINITDNSINLNLKDNNMTLNIGDSTANQQMILGTNWMNWFDKFVESFLQNLAFIGNAGSPVLISPAFAKTLAEYQSLKDSKFLSHHVNVVDNNKVSTVKIDSREEVAQSGDAWKSTKTENTLTTVSEETSKPVEGEKPPYDEKFASPDATDPSVKVEDPITLDPTVVAPPNPKELQSNKDIEKLVWFMKSKNYVIYENNHELNIVGMRSINKIEGDVTNKFDEIMYVFYRDENSNWNLSEFNITTVPGLKPPPPNNPKLEVLPEKVAMLRLGQYVEQLKMSNFGDPNNENMYHKCLVFERCAIHRNTEPDFYDWDSPTEIGPFPVSIHRASKRYPSVEKVYIYSKGSQVFKSLNQYDLFMKLVDNQINKAKKDKFTYTLCSEKEYKAYPDPSDQKKLLDNIPTPKPPIQAPPAVSVESVGKVVNDKIIPSLIDLGFSSEPGKPSLQEWINKGQKFSDVLGKSKGVDFSQARNNLDNEISLKIESGEIKQTDYIKDGLLNGINVIKERTIENDGEANNLMIDLGLNQRPTKITEIKFIPFSN